MSGYRPLAYDWLNAHGRKFPENVGKRYFDNYKEADDFFKMLKSKRIEDLAKQRRQDKINQMKWEQVSP